MYAIRSYYVAKRRSAARENRLSGNRIHSPATSVKRPGAGDVRLTCSFVV